MPTSDGSASSDRRVDQMHDLVGPAEVMAQRGGASEVKSSVVVLDLADMRRVRVDGGARQDLLDLGRTQWIGSTERRRRRRCAIARHDGHCCGTAATTRHLRSIPLEGADSWEVAARITV